MATDRYRRCDYCKALAVAYMRGAKVCARCGTTLATDPAGVAGASRHRSFSLAGLSLGLAGKVLLSGVALAATVTATTAGFTGPGPTPEPPTAQVLSLTLEAPPSAATTSVVPSIETVKGAVSRPAGTPNEATEMEIVERAIRMAEAVHAWAECVSATAAAGRGPMSPVDMCGPRPTPTDFGLGPPADTDHGRPEAPGASAESHGPPDHSNAAAASKSSQVPPGQAAKP